MSYPCRCKAPGVSLSIFRVTVSCWLTRTVSGVICLSRTETLVSTSPGSAEPHAAAKTEIHAANPAQKASVFRRKDKLNLSLNSQPILRRH